MAKEIKYGAEARKALETGVNKLADSYRYSSRCDQGYEFQGKWQAAYRKSSIYFCR